MINSKKNVRWSFITVLVTAALLSSCSRDHEFTVVSNGITTLRVPTNYTRSSFLFWIREKEGLDSDAHSVLVNFPDDEVEKLKLPQRQGLRAVISVLNDTERARFQSAKSEEADKILKRISRVPSVTRVDPDPLPGLYRVYDDVNPSIWVTLGAEPDRVTGADVIGTCMLLVGGSRNKCDLRVDIDGAGVAYSLNAENLAARQRVSDYIARLLSQWRTPH